jgi:hypothetical protein
MFHEIREQGVVTVCSEYYRLKARLPVSGLRMFYGLDNFFIMAGTAAATMIGLLFVAITVGSGMSTSRAVYGTHAFLTPTLIRFSGVLFECMAVLFPWLSALPVGIILGLCGLTGLVHQIQVILMQRKVDYASLDWLDWTLFSVAPAFGNASMIVGAAGLIAEKSFAPYAIAGAITLLLFAGIYSAWDLTLWLARNKDKT